MKRNDSSKKLYFLILIITSITSYIILSIDKSEVFSYIYEDNRYYLLDTIRLIYLVSLVFIFVLIYYASFYMISERKDDLGLLMAEGVGERRLFKILFKDSIKDFFRANILGISLSIFFNEFINLFTAKILKLGLNYHTFSISFKAIFLTFFVSLILNSLSIHTIVRDFYKKTPDLIFRGKIKSRSNSFLFLALLLFMVWMLLNRYLYQGELIFIVAITTLFLFVFFFILSKILLLTNNKDLIVRKSLALTFKKDKMSLIFTSFMLIVGIYVLSYTILTSISSKNALERPADFTLYDSKEKVDLLYNDENMKQMIGDIYPVYGYEYSGIDVTNLKDCVKDNFGLDKSTRSSFYFEPRFLLKESSFNNIYKTDISLEKNEVILLAESENEQYALEDTLDRESLFVKIGGEDYKVRDFVKSNRIFSNDVIGLSSMVVVEDELYERLIGEKNPFAYNVNLSKDFINSFGFSKGSDLLREAFINGGYKYESYIWQAKNAILKITENLYTYFYLSLIFILAGLSFFTIRIFILFEKSKEKLKILTLMGQDMDEIKSIIRKEHTILFFTVGIVSIFISAFLFINSPFTSDIFYKLKFGKIMGTLTIIGLAFLILISIFLRFIIRVSFERIVYYEENFNN